jgi:Uma2 family endonuclease
MAAPARALSEDMQNGEFLKFIRPRPKEEYWQLLEGAATMMTPPSLVHQIVAHNLRDLLKEAVTGRGIEALALTEIGVRVPGLANFLPRPDVVVIPRDVATDEVYADRFLFVAEVLSPSNTKALIAQELRRYKQHPDNLCCVVIDSRRTWLQVHARRSGWQPATLDEPRAVLDLPEFGLRCALGDLYRDTPLEPARSAAVRRARPR